MPDLSGWQNKELMLIPPHIFREFSIRGVADRDLSHEVVVKIGRALGTIFRRDRVGKTLLVGRDVRVSSPRIGRSLITGLLQTGIDVIDVGLVPTPVQNFATDLLGAAGGVMITASHNPPEDNGLKIRADETLSGQAIQQIYHLAVAEDFVAGQGILESQDPLPSYLASLQRHVVPGRSLKIVVDGGTGANGLVVAGFLRKLDHTVIELFTEPNGSFPHRSPDPTKPEATAALSGQVLMEGADLGVAYDGDGDRLVVIDEQGNRVLGDQIMMILARQVLRDGPAKIVYEVSCTQALADDVIAHGGEPVIAPSGYAFVHQAMRDANTALGGELSGHLFFKEPGFRFDDAILGTVKLLNIMGGSHRSLSELMADLPRYHTSPNYRSLCPDNYKREIVQRIIAHYQATHPVDTTDGAKIIFERGWALVRQSNTQPALTFRFEGKTATDMENIKAEVLATINKEFARLGVPSVDI
jgi:phosphomannomutase/phosphoglucomutase